MDSSPHRNSISDRAAAQFLDALADQPVHPELVRQAFLSSLMSGRPEALGLARQMHGNQAADLLLANEAVRDGDWSEAERRFRSLPEAQIIRPVLIAWAQAGAGRAEDALNTLRPLAEGHRFRGIYALHAGLIAELAGRAPEAEDFYKQAVDAYGGGNLRLGQILGSFQARNGRQAEAMGTLAQITVSAPDLAIALPGLERSLTPQPVATVAQGIAEAYLAVAGTLDQENAPEYAMLLLRLSLDLRPGFTPTRLLMADILASQRHPERALRELGKVGPDDPLSPIVRLRHAGILERMGEKGAALRELEALAQDFPSSAVPEREIGDVLRASGRFAEAITAYDLALSRVGDASNVKWGLLYARGVAYERSHDWTRAEADFRHALAVVPDQPAVLNYLGYSWADMGVHLPEARQMIEKAVQTEPSDGAFIDSLGWVMLRQGEVGASVRTLEHAAEIEPSDPTINAHLGDAYWAAGRRLEAGYQWRHALTLHPEPADAQRIEGRLHDMMSQAAQSPAPRSSP